MALASSTTAELLRNADVRLCRLHLWPNYVGLGFNFEASSRPPHIIRLVESNSPAAAGGLKIRDLILMVNQEDVSEADYNHVGNAIIIARDSSAPIDLLVVGQYFYQSLKEKGISIDSSSATFINTPTTMPYDYLNFVRHQPRICNIRLDRFNSRFGFDVVNGENDVGVYIQEVFPNTPASNAQLRKSDRIIEIDDIFVDKDASPSILEKLDKAKAKGVVKLYVVDTETYRYYEFNKIPLTSKANENYELEARLPTHLYDTREREYRIIKYI
jgi:C-terminal processing protease CtpA/Prc